MNLKHIVQLCIALAALTSGAAHAVVEDWRLTAVVNSYSPSGFAAPSFASIGSTITIDYLIDESVPLFAGDTYNAVKSVSFNGQTSTGSGYVLSLSGLNALNASLSGPGSASFISLNSFTPVQPSLLATLNTIAAGISTSADPHGLRIDFNNDTDSVYATPLSLAPVPEPQTYALMLTGLGLLGIIVRRKRVKASI